MVQKATIGRVYENPKNVSFKEGETIQDILNKLKIELNYREEIVNEDGEVFRLSEKIISQKEYFIVRKSHRGRL